MELPSRSSDSSTGKKNIVDTDSAGGKKKVSASQGLVKASTGGKKKNVASQGLVIRASESAKLSASGKKKAEGDPKGVVKEKRKEPTKEDDDDDAPEEITEETALKKIRLEKKRIRDSVPKNPFRCPDMNAKNWTKKDKKNYYNWLVYKKGHLGLTCEEQEYLQTVAVNKRKGTGRRTSLH